MSKNKGFTLPELLVVIAVIGILTAMAVVRTGSVKARAYKVVMEEDLRNLAVAEEGYFSEQQTYTSDLTQLDVSLSNGVSMTINASGVGWTAQATHPQAEGRKCALYVGNIAPLSPASHQGIVKCAGTFSAPGCGGS